MPDDEIQFVPVQAFEVTAPPWAALRSPASHRER